MNFLNILFPEKCVYCKKYGKYICQDCFNKINNKYFFRKVKNEYYDYIVCISVYKDDIRIKMHNFKFHECAYLYKYFIELILNNVKICDFLKNFELITYVPMSENKKNLRGYNQSELLANELGKKLNIKVCSLLEKVKENEVQSSLSKNKRLKNVENVYDISNIYKNDITNPMINKDFKFNNKNSIKLKRKLEIENKNIILVDDIFTTGATVNACSHVLRKYKVNKICVLAISKTNLGS